MNSPFNAIDYAQQLEAAGVPATQAEVHAKTLSLALTSCAASRADLDGLNDRLSTRTTALEQRLTTRMDLFEQRISARMDKFVAELSARMDNFEAKMSARMDNFEAKMSARMDNFDAKIELRLEKMESSNKLTQLMAATNSAILIAVLVKVYFP
jgi:exonuclease VII large subunit